jgi:FMN phosphatase YigB (HAD superfamily)
MLRALTFDYFDYWDTLYEDAVLAERVAVKPREQGDHGAADVDAADNALLMLPPAMLPGAWQMLRSLSRRFIMAVIDDTGLASGRAQDRLLQKDAARDFFAATLYSAAGAQAKSRPRIFAAAAEALGLAPVDILHVGDDERSDVRGALAAGFRAVRLDVVRQGGPSEAEFVARSYEELTAYLKGQAPANARET